MSKAPPEDTQVLRDPVATDPPASPWQPSCCSRSCRCPTGSASRSRAACHSAFDGSRLREVLAGHLRLEPRHPCRWYDSRELTAKMSSVPVLAVCRRTARSRQRSQSELRRATRRQLSRVTVRLARVARASWRLGKCAHTGLVLVDADVPGAHGVRWAGAFPRVQPCWARLALQPWCAGVAVVPFGPCAPSAPGGPGIPVPLVHRGRPRRLLPWLAHPPQAAPATRARPGRAASRSSCTPRDLHRRVVGAVLIGLRAEHDGVGH